LPPILLVPGLAQAGVAVEKKTAVEGRSSVAGSVHEALLSFMSPKPSNEARDRRPESEARPDGVDPRDSREQCCK
jgi:hypothetical protein